MIFLRDFTKIRILQAVDKQIVQAMRLQSKKSFVFSQMISGGDASLS